MRRKMQRTTVERRKRVINYVTVTKDLVQCEPVYVSFGKIIRDHRLKRGWTQTDLAERVGLARTSVTNIEIGRQRILLSDLFDFARAFDVSAKSLFNALEP